MNQPSKHGGILDPVHCGECGARMVLRTSRFKTLRGQARQFWGCSRYPDCKGAIGAHPDGRPLGVPGDRAVRDARIEAHAVFDKLWKNATELPAYQGRELDDKAKEIILRAARRRAYEWMRYQLQMSKSECHIASMGIEDCRRAIVEASNMDSEKIRMWHYLVNGGGKK
jgi:ssDNA-binding Zn-finger/Zn-ribbon topoisomerase 1